MSKDEVKERRTRKLLADLEAQVAALPPDRQGALKRHLTDPTASERQQRYAQRQTAKGRIKPGWWLDRDLVDSIRRQATAIGGDRADAINKALRSLADGDGAKGH